MSEPGEDQQEHQATLDLVMAAIDAITQHQEAEVEALAVEIQRTGAPPDVMQAVVTFGELLRRSGDARLEERVASHIAFFAPNEEPQRAAFEALARALLLDADPQQGVDAINAYPEVNSTEWGLALLGTMFVAGRTAEDLAVTFNRGAVDAP